MHTYPRSWMIVGLIPIALGVAACSNSDEGASGPASLPPMVHFQTDGDNYTDWPALASHAQQVVVAEVGPVVTTESQVLDSPTGPAKPATTDDAVVNAVYEVRIVDTMDRANATTTITEGGTIRMYVSHLNPENESVKAGRIVDEDRTVPSGPLSPGTYLLLLDATSNEGAHPGWFVLTDESTGAIPVRDEMVSAPGMPGIDGRLLTDIADELSRTQVDDGVLQTMAINAKSGG